MRKEKLIHKVGEGGDEDREAFRQALKTALRFEGQGPAGTRKGSQENAFQTGPGLSKGRLGRRVFLEVCEALITHLLFWIYLNAFCSK